MNYYWKTLDSADVWLDESKMSTILHNICEVQTDRTRQRFRKIVDRIKAPWRELRLQAKQSEYKETFIQSRKV